MGRIIYSPNIKFDMSDWEKEDIANVYAGLDCAMGLTKDGRVLQKIADSRFAARTEYWRNIRKIAISNYFSGLAIGLVNDGTCMIAKRPLRYACDVWESNFSKINNKIKSWRNIVEVAASDAFFALDESGKVHYATLASDYDDYKEIEQWENVIHIVAGLQNSVFGITRAGKVLCAGDNCVQGAHGNLKKYLEDIEDVHDVCTLGSECGEVILAMKNGSVKCLRNRQLDVVCCATGKILESNLWATVLRDKDEKLHVEWYCGENSKLLDGFENELITDFALGCHGYNEPFLMGIRQGDC